MPHFSFWHLLFISKTKTPLNHILFCYWVGLMTFLFVGFQICFFFPIFQFRFYFYLFLFCNFLFMSSTWFSIMYLFAHPNLTLKSWSFSAIVYFPGVKSRSDSWFFNFCWVPTLALHFTMCFGILCGRPIFSGMSSYLVPFSPSLHICSLWLLSACFPQAPAQNQTWWHLLSVDHSDVEIADLVT